MDTAPANKSTASASQAKQPNPAERLAELMVSEADVNGFGVKKPTTDFVFATSQDEVTLDKPACASLAYAMNQLPLGKPQADLTRVLSAEKGADGDGFTYVTLASYGPGGASSAMSGVVKAVRSCGTGFTAKAGGGSDRYDSVKPEKVTPAGDESLGFKATLTFNGASHGLHTEIVRKGDVLAVYFSVDGLAIANASPSDAQLPKAVVTAQNAKLR
ncbi:hypothetical protein ACWEQ7_27310 [Streptomyces sp. NPDC004069]